MNTNHRAISPSRASRRGFLLTALAIAGGTVAATIAVRTRDAGTTQVDAGAPQASLDGYRETAHVRRYYATARG